MSSPSHSIRVRILNRDFSLRVSEQDERLTRELARYVDEKMQDFLRKHPDQPEITASIIAAMAIAEELFTEREERERLETLLEKELRTLADRLDDAAPVEPTPTDAALS